MGWLCKQTGDSSRHLSRLLAEQEIEGVTRSSGGRWRLVDTPALKEFIGKRRKAKERAPASAPLRRRRRPYVHMGTPYPTTLPADEFAARLRHARAKGHDDLPQLADWLREKTSDEGLAAARKALRQEGVADVNILRAETLLTLPKGAKAAAEILMRLPAAHARVVKRAEGLDSHWRLTWLERAVKQGLSATRLRASIRSGRVLTRKEMDERSGHNSGVPNVHAVRYQYGRWRRVMLADNPIEGWSQEDTRAWLVEMEPILLDAQRVRARISQAATTPIETTLDADPIGRRRQ